MNGFTDKDMLNPDKLDRIELTLEDLQRMNIVTIFKGLKYLTLINVGLT